MSNRVMVSHWSLMLGRVWWLPTRTNWLLHEKDQNPKFVLSYWILIAVRVLNSIFRQWGISASSQWRTIGEPCTGAAIDSTSIDSADYNFGIKCDCSYDNASTCHITQLYVHVFVLGLLNITQFDFEHCWYISYKCNPSAWYLVWVVIAQVTLRLNLMLRPQHWSWFP